MQSIHALGKALLTSLAAVLSRTSSSQGSGVDLRDYEGQACFVLSAGAATAGTNPTLDVTFEESDDDSTYSAVPYADFSEGAEMTQVTTTAGMQIRHFDVTKRKRYVRAKWVIGGTSSPAFPFGVGFIGQKKYS